MSQVTDVLGESRITNTLNLSYRIDLEKAPQDYRTRVPHQDPGQVRKHLQCKLQDPDGTSGTVRWRSWLRYIPLHELHHAGYHLW
jgi:hypothetical protein